MFLPRTFHVEALESMGQASLLPSQMMFELIGDSGCHIVITHPVLSFQTCNLTCRVEDPEDEPGFLERNPTWEDSLDSSIIVHHTKLENETKEGKLQTAMAAIAKADGGVIIGKHDTRAQKHWKNAYLSLKRLLVRH